jgi:TP901 family phage tail tape measure protein
MSIVVSELIIKLGVDDRELRSIPQRVAQAQAASARAQTALTVNPGANSALLGQAANVGAIRSQTAFTAAAAQEQARLVSRAAQDQANAVIRSAQDQARAGTITAQQAREIIRVAQDQKTQVVRAAQDEVQALRGKEAAWKRVADGVRSAGSSMADAGRRMTVGITAPIIGIGAAAVKSAATFDQAMRNVNSIAQLPQSQFENLKQSVLSVTSDPTIRQGAGDLAKALYDVYSSGFTGQKALDVLRVSAKGASAGMTDTATSSRALMAVLNSGIPGVKNAQQGMDVLFKIVDRGVVNFGELSGSIGAVLPIAAKAGISLQQVGAYIAVATKQGQSGSEAINDLNNLITKIIRPSEGAAKMMDAMGISYGLTALKSKGLATILGEISAKTAGNQDALAKLFPDMQAFRGLLAAGANGGATFRAELEQMGLASQGLGATQRALAEQNKGATAQWELLKKQLETVGIQIGNALLPLLNQLVPIIQQAVTWFTNLSPAGQQSVLMFAAVAAAAGPVVFVAGQIVTGVGMLIQVFNAVRPIMLGVSAVLSGPVGIALAAVAAGIALLTVAWRNNWFDIQGRTKAALDWLRAAIPNAWNFLKNATASFFGSFLPSLMQIGQNIVQGIVHGIQNGASAAINAVRNLAINMLNTAKRVLGIASPSRVFMEMGQQSGQGLVNGLNSMKSAVGDAGAEMMAELRRRTEERALQKTIDEGFARELAEAQQRQWESDISKSGFGHLLDPRQRQSAVESKYMANLQSGASWAKIGNQEFHKEDYELQKRYEYAQNNARKGGGQTVNVTQNIYGDVNNEADENRVTRKISTALERTLRFAT